MLPSHNGSHSRAPKKLEMKKRPRNVDQSTVRSMGLSLAPFLIAEQQGEIGQLPFIPTEDDAKADAEVANVGQTPSSQSSISKNAPPAVYRVATTYFDFSD